MRAGRTAGRTYFPDDFADADELADLHIDLRQVAVTGRQAIAVIDLDHIAVAAFPARNRHAAGRGRAHGFADLSTQVDACMNRRAAQEWIHAHAEWRTHVYFADNGLANRHCDQCVRESIDLRAGDVDAVKLPFERAGS